MPVLTTLPRHPRLAARRVWLRRSALGAALLAAAVSAQAQAVVGEAPTTIAPQVEAAYAKLQAAPAIQKLMDAVRADQDRSTKDLIALTEIEAPPFKETAKAQAFLELMRALGLPDAKIDGEGNAVGVRKGTGKGPLLVISAHLDTVFPLGTDVKVKQRDGRLHAPGISDDTRGLAVLLSWLKVLNDQKIQTVGDLMFVGNVGEEELGNLRGVKHLFKEHPNIDGMVGLEPVNPGDITVLGTGSHRWEATFKGPGGHSYAAFGQVPSAIHAMGRAVATIADVQVPAKPKTTFTVGTVKGGTSVNTIAPEAAIAIDIRSEENGPMLDAEKKILAAVDQAVVDENRRWNVDTMKVEKKLIGDRPGGRTPVDSLIVQAAATGSRAYGYSPKLVSASTDANVPMSLGIPAVILSPGGKTGGFHAITEWIDLTDAWKGAQASLLTVLGLVGVQGLTEPLLPVRAETKR